MNKYNLEQKPSYSRNIQLMTINVLLILLCSMNSCNSKPNKLQNAINCANNWKEKGYDFDPNSMTCRQMYERVKVIEEIELWKDKGYNIHTNLMTLDEIKQKVKDIDRARFWNDKGCNFDPNTMTSLEMDQKGEELDKVKYWQNFGCYYDPNSKTVFLSANKKTKLESLTKLHEGNPSYQNSQPTYKYHSSNNPQPLERVSSGSGNIYFFTGDGHWVKEKIDSGKFIQLEDGSLWQVNSLNRLNTTFWLPLDDIVVAESDNPYYPYLLINTDDGELVEAKIISK